jgi:hypothetical protein
MCFWIFPTYDQRINACENRKYFDSQHRWNWRVVLYQMSFFQNHVSNHISNKEIEVNKFSIFFFSN